MVIHFENDPESFCKTQVRFQNSFHTVFFSSHSIKNIAIPEQFFTENTTQQQFWNRGHQMFSKWSV